VTPAPALPVALQRSPRARKEALAAALALVAEAERRATSLRCPPHEAVRSADFATLAAALRRQAKEQP
jgi:hypothetical protein